MNVQGFGFSSKFLLSNDDPKQASVSGDTEEKGEMHEKFLKRNNDGQHRSSISEY